MLAARHLFLKFEEWTLTVTGNDIVGCYKKFCVIARKCNFNFFLFPYYIILNVKIFFQIFLHICSFLDTISLNNLNFVCKYIHTILADQSIWRSRLRKRWCVDLREFPPIPPGIQSVLDFKYPFYIYQIQRLKTLNERRNKP